jgi:hypothetical protein
MASTYDALGEKRKCPAPSPFSNRPSKASVPASRTSSNWTGADAVSSCALARPFSSVSGTGNELFQWLPRWRCNWTMTVASPLLAFHRDG